ncbi:MAG: hypothetical protein JWM75_3102 [Sphingomonas bacterium]|nr:hypothetical protein [Sphingomonas bacterium]
MSSALSQAKSVALALLLAAWPVPGTAAVLGEAAAQGLRGNTYLWDDSAARGPVRIVIDRARQRAYVYRAGRLIGVSTVSTGKAGKSTPLGTFTILEKRLRHRSNLYSNAPMPFMQRLTWDGIALHAGPLPGYPASHGCIRLPWTFAQRLFAATALGAVVEVTDDGPAWPKVQMASAPKPVPRPPRPAAPPPPVVLASAAPPAAPERRPAASWLEQSADDYVLWGSGLPAGASADR